MLRVKLRRTTVLRRGCIQLPPVGDGGVGAAGVRPRDQPDETTSLHA
jgi:hypothetical protein